MKRLLLCLPLLLSACAFIAPDGTQYEVASTEEVQQMIEESYLIGAFQSCSLTAHALLPSADERVIEQRCALQALILGDNAFDKKPESKPMPSEEL